MFEWILFVQTVFSLKHESRIEKRTAFIRNGSNAGWDKPKTQATPEQFTAPGSYHGDRRIVCCTLHLKDILFSLASTNIEDLPPFFKNREISLPLLF